MIWFKDLFGNDVRLTDERRFHLETSHPEMVGQLEQIAKTLEAPERVVASLSDISVDLFYRYYSVTPVGGKYFCVVVKTLANDAFVLTAYFTDSIKKGDTLWPEI